MLSQVERDVSTWLPDVSVSWSDDLTLDKTTTTGLSGEELLDKVDDNKLARDVEDLSAIFEELEGGVVDFPLPCDEEDVATGAEVTGDWIGDLEKDVVNVEELSAVFDALVSEQEVALDKEVEEEGKVSSEEDEVDVDEDEDDDDEEEEDETPSTTPARAIVHVTPKWIHSAPVDPRSLIRTPIFKNLDSRIPTVQIPRIDLAFGAARFTVKPTKSTTAAKSTRVVTSLDFSPRQCKDKVKAKQSEYRHNPATCWICKSDKSTFRKFALHRYLEKRHRRNWKRGPRYSGRSHVATNRVREGGRFVQTAHWI